MARIFGGQAACTFGLAAAVLIIGSLLWAPAASSQAPAKGAQTAADEKAGQPKTGAEPGTTDPKTASPKTGGAKDGEAALKPIELSKDLKKLGEAISIDNKNKWVVLDGEVALRKGPPLEMFACLKNTKEHESIVSVPVKAIHVHGALIAIGAKQGKTVQFEPTYKPATGQEIEVRVLWTDDKGVARQARAQDWIRDIQTKKAMAHPFVFAGSSFWTDEDTGQKHYLAEGGELICVSNFSSALLDLPVESSQATGGLMFEAFSEHIPAEGTKVQLVLMPKRADEGKAPAKTPDKTPKAASGSARAGGKE